MKLFRLFGTCAIILSAIICSSCTVTQVYENTIENEVKEVSNENSEVESEAPATEGFGKMGFAVDADDAAYYWKFTGDDFEEGALFAAFNQKENASVELVRFENGVETTVAQTGCAEEFVVTDKAIYYSDGNGSIICAGLDGTNPEECAKGTIKGVTEDGKYIVYTASSNEFKIAIYAINTETSESVKIAENTDFVAIHDGIIYHTPNEEDFDAARRGLVSLYAAKPDASENRRIYTSDADMYDGYFSDSAVRIAQIRFGDEYIYFSYGGIAGTGHFYCGGNIVRVKYDGSGAETLYTFSDERYIDSEFTVNPDGSVTAIDVSENDGLYSFRDKYITRDGNILWFDDITGEPARICSYFPDDSHDISIPKFVNVTDRYAFFVTHYGTYLPEKNVGWRDYYIRDKGIFYMIDRETGEIVTSYEF